jgi:hypothetical protein
MSFYAVNVYINHRVLCYLELVVVTLLIMLFLAWR